MAKYDSRKVGEIHRVTKRKTDWGAIIGGFILVFVVLGLIGSMG